MASKAAIAIKYDLAMRKMKDAMQRIADYHGVTVPPPVGKTDSMEDRHACEAVRMANFLASVADALPVKENQHA